jgi:hypothetical protein
MTAHRPDLLRQWIFIVEKSLRDSGSENLSSSGLDKCLIYRGLASRRIAFHSGIIDPSAHAHLPQTRCKDAPARGKSVQKVHKSAQKALFYDTNFQRNCNSINELRRNAQYPSPSCNLRISGAIPRLFAQLRITRR